MLARQRHFGPGRLRPQTATLPLHLCRWLLQPAAPESPPPAGWALARAVGLWPPRDQGLLQLALGRWAVLEGPPVAKQVLQPELEVQVELPRLGHPMAAGLHPAQPVGLVLQQQWQL